MMIRIGPRMINPDHITNTFRDGSTFGVGLVHGNVVVLSGDEAIKFQAFLEASSVSVDETADVDLTHRLKVLEAAAMDAIEKIDAAADGRINFRRDFAMRLREAMGILKLARGDWSDPR